MGKTDNILLHHHSRFYARMFADSPLGIVVYDAQGGLVAVNKACRDMVGVPSAYLVPKWFANLFSDPTIPDWAKKKLKDSVVVRYKARIDYDHLRELGLYSSGTRFGVRYVKVVTTPLGQKRNGSIIGYMTQVEDVTDLTLAEERLKEYQDRLRSLSSQLSLVEERERRRLASGLHDNIGQTLSLIRFKLGAVNSIIGDESGRKGIAEIRALVDEAAEQTRALTFELSPPVLYELGLEPALEWLAEQYEAKYDMAVRFKSGRNSEAISDELRGILFSSVRELLMNAAKHAKAKVVRIAVRKSRHNLFVSVKDDGVGFDTSGLKSCTQGFGLFNIRERLEAVGGRMELVSAPSQGTSVTLAVPFRPAADTVHEEVAA